MKLTKRYTFLALLAATSALPVLAGGLAHNTNMHTAWNRMMARGASNEIDAVFTNPAGTAWMDHEGWTLSLNVQSAFQERDITATFPLFTDENHTHRYEGSATAPFIPEAYVTYKKDRWAVSGFFGIIGGGGKATFENGLPMFDAAVMAGLASKSGQLVQAYPALQPYIGNYIGPDMYTIDSYMKGHQFIYGFEAVGAYRINNYLSAALGARFNYYQGGYKGHVTVSANEKLTGVISQLAPALSAANPQLASQLSGLAGEGGLANVQLDCKQSGLGFTPIVGLDFKYKGLTLAAKYEFKTNITIKNKTKTLEAPDEFASALSDYADGVKSDYDLPALLAVAAQYEIIPHKLRAAVEYHYFDDKHAEMGKVVNPDDPTTTIAKQKLLTRGTNEYLAGIEWDINKMFTVSCGGQITDYGLSDGYQTHTTFSCDSYSLGFGGAVNLSEKVKLNIAYFWTTYSDYTKEYAAGNYGYCGTGLAGKDIFLRTNKVFGVGIDYKF